MKDGYDNGEELYQYFFYNRKHDKDTIENAVKSTNQANNTIGLNITIVGNPGQGKTCLMHSIFLDLKSQSDIYPIILDYRAATPKSAEGLLTEFVQKMRDYYKSIDRTMTTLTEKTCINNAEDHLSQVTIYLQNLRKSDLTKKLIIFLDDLDYAEDDYVKILKTYFLNYASSDKCSVILTARKPLINSLSSDDELRQCYKIQPRTIELTEVDLQSLIYCRLKSIIDLSEKETYLSKLTTLFRKPTLDDFLLKLYKKVDKDSPDKIPGLPFAPDFYVNLNDLTFGNLRDVEELMPIFCEYELSNKSPRFNDNFMQAFIANTFDKKHILLDLVSEKTFNKKRHLNGNSIYQIVLEYFYFQDIVNEMFYETMGNYGINDITADNTIKALTNAPFALIEPEYIYSLRNPNIYRRYLINNKGRKYVTGILRDDYYYNKTNQTKSSRSYYTDKITVK